jgi:DNA-binding HxlR family transcriptional regulator
MEHSFDIDIAKEYGIPAAILLKHIYYWVEKNKANAKHYRDGCFWTYNSLKAFCKLFPYMSESTIKRSLKKLAEDGLIVEAVYNDVPFDRTKWYTLTSLGYEKIKQGIGDSNDVPLDQNDQSHQVKMNQSDEVKMGEPIPYKYNSRTQINNNKSISKDIDSPSESEGPSGRSDIEDVIHAWNELSEYGIAPIKKISCGSKRYKCLRARLREYGKEDVISAINNIAESGFLQGNNYRAWVITFDWFVCPTNFPKVLEGNYRNRNDNSKPTKNEPDYGDWQRA